MQQAELIKNKKVEGHAGGVAGLLSRDNIGAEPLHCLGLQLLSRPSILSACI